MGCSSSKLLEAPTSPLQELQYNEAKRQQRRRNDEKRQRQIAKLHKKHNNKKHGTTTATTIVTTKRQSTSTVSDSRRSMPGRAQQQRCSASDDSIERMSSNADGRHFDTLHQDEYNARVEQRTRYQLDNELYAFLMNQIVLTTQFFEHFQSELTSIYNELLAKENVYNQKLTEQSILFANPLDAAVARRIKYKPIHGPDKQRAQPLQKQLMYVVFENIDIARPNDANYDSIAPLCKVLIETEYYRTTPCKLEYVEMMREIKWKGYVRLKLREDAKLRRSISANANADGGEEIYTDGSSGYSTTSGYSGVPKRGNAAKEREQDDIYDYVYIERLNTHHPMSELRMSNQRERILFEEKVLPESCVSKLEHFIAHWLEVSDDEEDDDDYNDDDDDDDEENDEYQDVDKEAAYEKNEVANDVEENIKGAENDEGHCDANDVLPPQINYESINPTTNACEADQARRLGQLQQSYLNSKEFMHYFGELLHQKLANQLHIPKAQLATATYRGCSIYTTEYEIVPAIHVAHNWPDCAFSFRLRERPIVVHPMTGEQTQWPTRSMITRIESFGFHVVPMGYAPKRQRNPFRELEWRIVFPKAERYLEQHLTGTQIKVFMLAKALVKSFVEPHEKRKTLMFAFEHLRTHLFWECERDYAGWPEEFLGDVLLRFIRSFMTCLSKKYIPDYFIEERNLFENIPEDSLATLYSIMADIAEYPLMHLLVAQRNLVHADDFFPKLDFKKLFENIIEHDLIKLRQLSQHSHSLFGLTEQECIDAQARSTCNDHELTTSNDRQPAGLIGMRQQQQEKTKGKLRKKTQLMRQSIVLQQQLQAEREGRRESLDSIEMELIVSKHARSGAQQRPLNAGVENLRRTNLLELLLQHVLAMLEKSIALHNPKLARLYFMQARRLCTCYHNLGCDVSAKEYFMRICNAEHQLSAMPTHNEHDAAQATTPPALPRRFSEEQAQSVKHQAKVCPSPSPASSSKSTPEPRKSLKFTALPVEVHECQHTPTAVHDAPIVGILRNVNAVHNPEDDTNEASTPTADTSLSMSAQLFNKLTNVGGANAKMLQKFTTKTEQMLQNFATETKNTEICEIFKRQTLKLKGALNQSSET